MDKKNEDTVHQAAAHWFETMMEATDEAGKRLRKAADGEGTKGVMVEQAVLNATSNRELGAAMSVSAETVAASMKHSTRFLTIEAQALAIRLDELRTRIEIFTKKADSGTNRLILATYVLAAAALIAAWVGYYATTHTLPQVIVVPLPRVP